MSVSSSSTIDFLIQNDKITDVTFHVDGDGPNTLEKVIALYGRAGGILCMALTRRWEDNNEVNVLNDEKLVSLTARDINQDQQTDHATFNFNDFRHNDVSGLNYLSLTDYSDSTEKTLHDQWELYALDSNDTNHTSIDNYSELADNNISKFGSITFSYTLTPNIDTNINISTYIETFDFQYGGTENILTNPTNNNQVISQNDWNNKLTWVPTSNWATPSITSLLNDALQESDVTLTTVTTNLDDLGHTLTQSGDITLTNQDFSVIFVDSGTDVYQGLKISIASASADCVYIPGNNIKIENFKINVVIDNWPKFLLHFNKLKDIEVSFGLTAKYEIIITGTNTQQNVRNKLRGATLQDVRCNARLSIKPTIGTVDKVIGASVVGLGLVARNALKRKR
uniref:Uncharacterized protein n=1 Tax=Megaviridae environmental sample TaxID=1737588 RepID=A0A5J6VHJ0_9VIRU|nr:MAG: hypothetical protein [Megaviridae environmental sample]